MTEKEIQKRSELTVKILTRCTYVVCAFLLLCTVVGIIGASFCSIARNDRERLLESQFAETMLSTRWDNGLSSETVDTEITADGQQIYWRTYKFTDGAIVTVDSKDVYRNLQYKKLPRKFLSILKGSDILRQKNVADDGSTYILYKLPTEASLALSDGHTVYYDEVVRVIDIDTNNQINSCYITIKRGGVILMLASLFFAFNLMTIITLIILKEQAEKRFGVKSDEKQPDTEHSNPTLVPYDDWDDCGPEEDTMPIDTEYGELESTNWDDGFPV